MISKISIFMICNYLYKVDNMEFLSVKNFYLNATQFFQNICILYGKPVSYMYNKKHF